MAAARPRKRHPHPVEAAAEIVRHRGFDRKVKEIAIGHPGKEAIHSKNQRWIYRAAHPSSSVAAAMKAASASRSEGGMVRPSLVRRHRMSSGKRAHSFC